MADLTSASFEPTLGLGYEIFASDLVKVASASVCLEVEVGVGKLVDNIWTVSWD